LTQAERPFQGGIANLWWYADPTSEVAAIIFNSVLPYGSECPLQTHVTPG
jgi:hypothetical protein